MKFVKKFWNRFAPLVFGEVTAFGGFFFYGLVLLFTLSLSLFNLFVLLLFGFVVSALITILVRTFYFKERPNKVEYSNYIEKIDSSSFPSLHTGRVFYMALVVSYFFQNVYLTALMMFLAIITAYSRVFLKRHDYYDLAGGVVLAVVCFGLSLVVF